MESLWYVLVEFLAFLTMLVCMIFVIVVLFYLPASLPSSSLDESHELQNGGDDLSTSELVPVEPALDESHELQSGGDDPTTSEFVPVEPALDESHEL
ncbi:hypothetical protein EJ110_NYTH16881 [Nymphaea thermarum]|nr:hypothetical protein EJ110_NYTH16881 [Nymphaea thermarum]